VLTDYYVYRECIEAAFFFQGIPLEDVFEGGLEGMGALVSVLLLRSFKVCCSSSESDPIAEV
jgi:hypothetical protein